MDRSEEMSRAEQRILYARFQLAHFFSLYFESTPAVLRGGDAAGDLEVSGSDHIPNRIVEGFVASVADHLRAWYRASAPTDNDSRPFLSVYADYTLWRAILEAAACAVWILGPDEREERILRGTRLAIYEWRKSVPLRHADGDFDQPMARLHAEQEAVVRRVCIAMGFDFDSLDRKGLTPSAVVNGARNHLGSAGQDLAFWWTVCSRYAHAQTLTVMLLGVRTSERTPDGETVNVTTDAELLADVVGFGITMIDMLVSLLRNGGFERRSRTE
ncbi:hypothetical protein [Agromyces sp. GXQ0307]|uniref:hypothetical protein n=1 Tax=Agromyces sp. GXQ0307 TaxID=3377835 RepID=UPI00383AE290